MPRFAANLHYLFTELPFLDRFEAAAAAGFKAVEFQVPYDYPATELSVRPRNHRLEMVLFDAPMGDWARGDRGIAAVPGREQEFRDGFSTVIEYASALKCSTVHVMAGAIGSGADYQIAERTYLSNLRHAAAVLGTHGIVGVIEPINKKMGLVANGPSYTTQGMHGYFLNHADHATRILREIDSPHLQLHLDLYHMQMLEGHLAETIRKQIGQLRHVQIAGVPGRHAGHRGNQLSLSVRSAGRTELFGLGRLRIPAPGRHLEWAVLGGKVWNQHCTGGRSQVGADGVRVWVPKKRGAPECPSETT